MKFISVVERDLPEGFIVLNIHTQHTFTDLLTRVVNSGSIELNEAHLKKYHGCPYAVGIDIFPVDYLPRAEDEAQVQMELLGIVLSAAQLCAIEDADLEEIGRMTEQIAQLCAVTWEEQLPMQYQLYRLAERLCAMYGKEDADDMGMPVEILNGRNFIYSKEAYDSSVMMPFETIQIPVPNGYDEILKAKYGEYMIPYIGKAGHAYPFYKEQREILRKYLKANGMSGERFGIIDEEEQRNGRV
jgi:lipopolysaccharide cholinephosphotransferase